MESTHLYYKNIKSKSISKDKKLQCIGFFLTGGFKLESIVFSFFKVIICCIGASDFLNLEVE